MIRKVSRKAENPHKEIYKKIFIIKKQINSEEVHPKLKNCNHTMEGIVIGTFFNDPFDLLQVTRTMFYI